MTSEFRNGLLALAGFITGLLILALAPTLLRQTAFDGNRLQLSRVNLIPLQQEERFETQEMETEPEPPPEPDVPDPPDMEPPELDVSEIEPPRTTYASTSADYGNTVQLPSLTKLGLKGVKVPTGNLSRKLAKTPLPGLPKHGPPKTRFNPDEVDKQPQGIATTQPMYPYRAKRIGIEGMVRIRFLVDKSGRTDLFKILEAKPPGEFEQVVEKTVKQWKFKPGIKDGRAVETWVQTTINFKLN